MPRPEGKDYVASQYRQLQERSFEDVISLPMQAIDRPSQRIDPMLASRVSFSQNSSNPKFNFVSSLLPILYSLLHTNRTKNVTFDIFIIWAVILNNKYNTFVQK